MSYSKLLPPCTFDVLFYLNRDQFERFSIVCRPFKNIIDRYFNSKPYRVFDKLYIRGGLYALIHNGVPWHPNRDYYSVKQFLAGQKCDIDKSEQSLNGYYSFAEMRPYFGPTVRINMTVIDVASDFISNPELIKEMESISYLWRVGTFVVIKSTDAEDAVYDYIQIDADDLQPFLNSPTILQCRHLAMLKAHFSFKDYKILNAVDVFGINYGKRKVDPNSWLQFLEQPGAKPVVVFNRLCRESIDNVLDHISKAFSSAVSPNTFKIVFIQGGEELTLFRELNKNSGEILELKKGLPIEYQKYWNLYNEYDEDNNYTLERSRI